ncbi:MAG: ATP-binding protein, partial [Desulfovibrionaceae bacterium]
AMLRGDATRLRQVLHNLTANAVKFTEQGSVRVEVGLAGPACRPDEAGPRPVLRLLLAVHDTGVGIPEAQLEAVFSDFVQGDDSYTRRHRGAGLGLAIVRHMVELMGGAVVVDSTVGQGTSVYVTLRVQAVPEEDAWAPVSPGSGAESGPESEGGSEGESPAAPVAPAAAAAPGGMPVLLSGGDALRPVLEAAGFAVRTAGQGEALLAALAEAGEERPRALILSGTGGEAEDLALLRAVRDLEGPAGRMAVLCVADPEHPRDWAAFFEAGLSGLVPGGGSAEAVVQALLRGLD